MDFGKIPEGMDVIDAKKKFNSFLRDIKNESKPEKCVLCGKEQTSFCNSHSVPKMVLKKISENGKVLQANDLVGLEVIDLEKGVNNSGTFHFICNACDNKLFKDYESPDSWNGTITDTMLAQIALKDVVLMLSKRNLEQLLFKKAGERVNVEGLNYLQRIQELDVRDFQDEMELYKGIVSDKIENFKLVYYKKLPYVTPVATQTAIAMTKDLEGNEINDVFNMSDSVRIQNIHISIFPLEEETVILLFYHRRDKLYRRFTHQFNCLSDENKLAYINYLIFKYSENYYFSPKIKSVLENDKKLQMLAQENNEMPNLGYITGPNDLFYSAISQDEITNLLLPEYSIKVD